MFGTLVYKFHISVMKSTVVMYLVFPLVLYEMITNDVSDYTDVLVRIAHIICNLALL
jgi:hypothetical protein